METEIKSGAGKEAGSRKIEKDMQRQETAGRPDRDFVAEQADRMRELLQQRSALSRDDLEYLVEKVATLRDQRMQQCVAELIG